MDLREGFVPEEYLGQILVEGRWLDFTRGTRAKAKRWFEEKPETRRVVDWIYKERVIFPEPVHIHQGGTQNTFCGIPLHEGVTIVAWEDASKATCPGCSAHFPPPPSENCDHEPNGWDCSRYTECPAYRD